MAIIYREPQGLFTRNVLSPVPLLSPLLPPANEVCEGYVFTGVCHSVHRGGMHGCSGGACVVARGACA